MFFWVKEFQNLWIMVVEHFRPKVSVYRTLSWASAQRRRVYKMGREAMYKGNDLEFQR